MSLREENKAVWENNVTAICMRSSLLQNLRGLIYDADMRAD